MSEYVDFHYMPLEGKITGKQVLKQTEDAINDLGNKVYSLDIDQSEIDEAIEKSNEAINTANSALSAVTTGRSVWFNNVAEMVATDIDAGVTAETKGYHVANDGGNALYLIRQEKSGDVVDGGSLIALDNGNMAELVTDGTVNVKQFGAIGNGTDDDTIVFQNTSSYAQANGFVPFVGVATYKITGNVTGTFNSFGEVTITGGGTVDIINLQEVVSDVSDIRDEVVDETASAKAYSESAATSATNASNSASSASTTATQLMEYLETKETLTAPAVDPTLTISGAAADAKVTGRSVTYAVPLLRDGNPWNVGNANAVTQNYIQYLDTTKHTLHIEAMDINSYADEYSFGVALFRGITTEKTVTEAVNNSDVSKVYINDNFQNASSFPYFDYDIQKDFGTYINNGYTHFALFLTVKKNGVVVPLRIATNQNCIRYAYDIVDKTLSFNGVPADARVTGKAAGYISPVLRDGTIFNSGNVYGVTTEFLSPIDFSYEYLKVEYVGDVTSDAHHITLALFGGAATDGMTTTAAVANASVTKKYINDNADFVKEKYALYKTADFVGYTHFSFHVLAKLNNNYIALRIANNQNCMRYTYPTYVNDDTALLRKNNNARHIRGGVGTPLTFLHFSDLHKDMAALQRILTDVENKNITVDDMICTGDMVANTAEQIASWWNANVMTCIGNHDSASYSADTGYDWTALSMADRDAYYIAPFESNWGITHTAGTSYYYKDYTTQKVRLIVMDVMLYNDNGAEATAQTAWLANLLADAITNNLHVLIAVHAPHGGATAKECSFSKYGQGTMPTSSDCNTPQVVIDAVATSIGNGLHFIGYICGHTHQDNMWDAESNEKQLMYCITCASVDNINQWKNSDQHRSDIEDAFNLVTIDTTNTLVKIVRGGGADIDNHMRTRKAICFNYSTGEIVGEIL